MLKKFGAAILLFGLVLTAVGAGVAATGVIITPEQAQQLASTKFDLNEPLRDGLLDQSNKAKWGLILVALGTALQLIGTVVSMREG